MLERERGRNDTIKYADSQYKDIEGSRGLGLTRREYCIVRRVGLVVPVHNVKMVEILKRQHYL